MTKDKGGGTSCAGRWYSGGGGSGDVLHGVQDGGTTGDEWTKEVVPGVRDIGSEAAVGRGTRNTGRWYRDGSRRRRWQYGAVARVQRRLCTKLAPIQRAVRARQQFHTAPRWYGSGDRRGGDGSGTAAASLRRRHWYGGDAGTATTLVRRQHWYGGDTGTAATLVWR